MTAHMTAVKTTDGDEARMSIRCAPTLHERVKVEARARGLSLNDAVVASLERWLEAPDEVMTLIRLLVQDAHMARELLELRASAADLAVVKERTGAWIGRIRKK